MERVKRCTHDELICTNKTHPLTCLGKKKKNKMTVGRYQHYDYHKSHEVGSIRYYRPYDFLSPERQKKPMIRSYREHDYYRHYCSDGDISSR